MQERRAMIDRSPFADQQNDMQDEDLAPTRIAVARAFATHVLRLNEERQSNYRVAAIRAFDEVKERFRGADGELPAIGGDDLFDKLTNIVGELESSPEALRAACLEILRPR
jgi:hypothetical protein